MKLSSAKIIAVLGLSIILTNSGVAWALQSCLTNKEPGDHLHSAHTASASAASNRVYSSTVVAVKHRHQASPRIHCTETLVLKLWFGPVAPFFRLEPPKDNAVNAFLPAALLNASASALSGDSLPASIQLALKPRLSPHRLIPRLRI